MLIKDTSPKTLNLPLWGIHSLMLLAALIVASSFTVGEAITRGLYPVDAMSNTATGREFPCHKRPAKYSVAIPVGNLDH